MDYILALFDKWIINFLYWFQAKISQSMHRFPTQYVGHQEQRSDRQLKFYVTCFSGKSRNFITYKITVVENFVEGFGDGQIMLYKLVHNSTCSGLF